MPHVLEHLISNTVLASLFAVLAWVVGSFVRHPQVRHALWLVVLLRLIAPPVWTVDAPREGARPGNPETASSPPAIVASSMNLARATIQAVREEPFADSPQAPVRIRSFEGAATPARLEPAAPVSQGAGMEQILGKFRWSSLRIPLIAVWGAGTAVYIAIAFGRALSFARALNQSACVAPESLVTLIEEVAERVGLRRLPQVQYVDGVASPMVWRTGRRSTLIMPPALFESLSTAERRLLIAHELVHLRRGDDWLAWPAIAIAACFWWLPVSWIALRKLQQAAEDCCDMEVARVFSSERETYAEMLYRVAVLSSTGQLPSPLLSGMTGGGRRFTRRLAMILTTPFMRLNRTTRVGLCLLCAAALAVSPRTESLRAEEPAKASPEPAARESADTRRRAENAGPPADVFGRIEIGPGKVAVPSRLSDAMRKKITDKLAEQAKQPNLSLARESLKGLTGLTDRAAIESILVARLNAINDRPGKELAIELQRLRLAWEMKRRGIAEKKVQTVAERVIRESQFGYSRCVASLIVKNAMQLYSPTFVKALVEIARSEKIDSLGPPFRTDGVESADADEANLKALLNAHTKLDEVNSFRRLQLNLGYFYKDLTARNISASATALNGLQLVELLSDDIAAALLAITEDKDPIIQLAATRALSSSLPPPDAPRGFTRVSDDSSGLGVRRSKRDKIEPPAQFEAR